MTLPVITLRPLRPAACADATVVLDVLARFAVPSVARRQPRPPLNLALVLDRSGSMHGLKIDYAREAARCLVRQLGPEDRLSLTVFADEVDVLMPSTPVRDPAPVFEAIAGIRAGGSTDLSGGWRSGHDEVAGQAREGTLTRILLVSDGLANRGERGVGTLGAWAAEAAARGVGTTTLGVGDHYHEHLLETMAREGDGNYHFIEDPRSLPDIFEAELSGLATLVGERASLGLMPLSGASILEVLNDLDRTSRGGYKLPNLRSGNTIEVVIRLALPACPSKTEVLSVRLGWDAPGLGERQKVVAKLELPVVSREEWERLPEDPDVVRHVALLEASRSKRRVMDHIDRGDRQSVARELDRARRLVMAAPGSAETERELLGLQQLERDYASGDDRKLRKRAGYQAYSRERSRD